MGSSQSLTTVPHLSLRHTEARERAALIDVTSYDVHLDRDRRFVVHWSTRRGTWNAASPW